MLIFSYCKKRMTEETLSTTIEKVSARRVPFLIVFTVAFFLSYGALFMVDFIPEAPSDEVMLEDETETVDLDEDEKPKVTPRLHNEAMAVVVTDADATDTEDVLMVAKAALPHTIIIDKLDRTLPVNNPTSREVAALDEALLTGAVRHPDSATFTNEGNIFILAHSSYLPNVFNKYFQAFNGIQDLQWGDTVRLQSDDTEYVYRVERVYKAKADELTVPIANTGPRLTLATCNSFASKDDRFIVETKLINTRPL